MTGPLSCMCHPKWVRRMAYGLLLKSFALLSLGLLLSPQHVLELEDLTGVYCNTVVYGGSAKTTARAS